MSGSSGLGAAFPTGNPQEGQNRCVSSQKLEHWGHERMTLKGQQAPRTPRHYHARLGERIPVRSRSRVEGCYDGSTLARRIGELLVEGGVLSQSQLEQALFAQRKDGRKLGQLLVELSLVNEVHLTQTLSRQLGVPWVSLYHVDFSRALLNAVARETAEKYCLIPIFVRREDPQGETLFIAMDDPMNGAAIEEVARGSSLPVKPMIACPSDIRAAIRVYYRSEGTLVAVPALVPESAPAPSNPPPPAPESPPSRAPQLASKPPPPLKSSPSLPPKSSPSLPPKSSPSLSPESTRSLPPESTPAPASTRPSRAPPSSARTISLTLLDGTKISLPARSRRPPGSPPSGDDAPENRDQLTARDLVSALRAVAHGVDASDILGAEPRWEILFAALLSILLRKGLIADWEFVEEFRKV